MADRSSVISLFTGAMGLDLGLERAGFRVKVAVEAKAVAAKTISHNRPKVELVARPIEEVTTAELLERGGLGVGDVELVSAGPCCQAYSTAGKRQSVAEPRGELFRHFVRVVHEAKPRFFVMENVRGLLSAAIKHRPLAARGPGYPPLAPEELYGSAFSVVLDELSSTGYSIFFGVLNAADFGVPQRRERLIIVGSRDGQRVDLPSPTHAADEVGGLPRWSTLRDALADLADPSPAFSPFPPSKRRVIRRIPEGGNWRDLSAASQRRALGGAADSWGGRTGFFRRLSWDAPTPALTTRPDSKATMLCHPAEDRPLSVREYARVQQFPDEWAVFGTVGQQYEQIGNAVPVGLAEALGRSLRAARRRVPERCEPGVVYCGNPDLLARMAKARGTVLNPSRMREIAGAAEARDWMRGTHAGRVAIVDRIAPLR